VRLVFWEDAWKDYTSYTDRRVLQKINNLLEDIRRNGHDGIGKPEPLKHSLSGAWSRRITDEHRLVYRISGEDVEIVSCRYHYS
jgi:toxin YoeB